MGVDLSGTNKWRGGVLGAEGKVYGIPASSANTLVINPNKQTATRPTLGAIAGDAKWCGGVLAGDGKIYCIPYFATSILMINKNANVPSLPLRTLLSPHLNKF